MNKGKHYTGVCGALATVVLLLIDSLLVLLGIVSYKLMPETWLVSAIFFVIATMLFVFTVYGVKYVLAEEARNRRRDRERVWVEDDKPLRGIALFGEYEVLCETTVNKGEKLRICYRRIDDRLNELVVNGMVYDEKKGVFEFAHNLSAVVKGHRIDAGYDGFWGNYIKLDGVKIAHSTRKVEVPHRHWR